MSTALEKICHRSEGRGECALIAGRLLAGAAAVGMLIYSAVVTLYLSYLGFAGRCDRHFPVAGGRPARDPDDTFDLGINKRQADENMRGTVPVDGITENRIENVTWPRRFDKPNANALTSPRTMSLVGHKCEV